MIKLDLNLPEAYGLTSIHHRYNGNWIVCVYLRLPGEIYGLFHSSFEHPDISEAAFGAIAKCDAKYAEDQRRKKVKPLTDEIFDNLQIDL